MNDAEREAQIRIHAGRREPKSSIYMGKTPTDEWKAIIFLLRLLDEARAEAANLAKNLLKLQGDYNVRLTTPTGALAMERAQSIRLGRTHSLDCAEIARAIEQAERETIRRERMEHIDELFQVKRETRAATIEECAHLCSEWSLSVFSDGPYSKGDVELIWNSVAHNLCDAIRALVKEQT